MKTTKKGSALLLTTILLFVVLSMVVSLTYITVMEQKMSGKTKSSVGSFFNADSGVEWALNRIANINSDLAIGNSSAFNDPNIADGVTCPTGFNCTLYFLDENGKVITDGNTYLISDIKAVRSVGTNETGDVTQRAIEAAVGATGESICYTQYCNNNGAASSGEACPDLGGTQKHCPLAGFQEKAYLGTWGNCSQIGPIAYFSPPNGGCYGGHTYQPAGKAYLCCQ